MTISDQQRRYAKVIRSMITDENTLINSRMSWMSALHGLLFTALGFTWSNKSGSSVALIYILCISGMTIAALIGVTIIGSLRAIARLYNDFENYKKEWSAQGNRYQGPSVLPIHIANPVSHYLYAPILLSLLFFLAWSFILLIVLTRHPYHTAAGYGIAIVIIMLFAGITTIRAAMQSESSKPSIPPSVAPNEK